MSSVDFGSIRFEDGAPQLSTKVLGVNVEDIVKGLEEAQRIPILKKESQIETNTKKLAALAEMETAMTSLQSAVQKLRDPGLLSSTTDVFKSKAAYATSATLSNPSGIVGISAAQGADIGSFELKVMQVASTDQRVTSSKTSKTDDLVSANGTLKLNGVNVNLTETMSLEDVATAINATTATSKVKAQVLQLSDGNFRLVMNGTETGSVIDFAGSDASTLTDLDLTVLQQTSQSFGAGVNPLSTSDNLTINGVDVALDASDNLEEIATKINGAGIGNIKASVYETSDGKQHLLINSTNANTDVEIGAGTLATDLGFTANRIDEQLAAKVQYNGLTATRPTNSFSDLIPGLTFDVYQAAPNDSITVSVENDLAVVKEGIAEMVDAYNALAELIDSHQNISSSGEVSEDAVLYGNSLLRSVDQQLSGLLGGSIKGGTFTTGNITSFADVGIELGQDNRLTVDDTALDNALLTRFDDVKAIFAYVAESDNPNFVSIDRPDTMDPAVAGQNVDVVLRNRGEARTTTVNDANAPLGLEMDVLATGNVLTFDVNALGAVFGPGQNAGLAVGKTVKMTDANNPENYFVATISSLSDTDGVSDGSVTLKVVGKSNEEASGYITDWKLEMDRTEVLLNFSGNVATSNQLNSTASGVTKSFTTTTIGATETLTLDSDTAYGVGDVIRVEDQADPNNRYLEGRVTGYDAATKKLTYAVIDKVGVGNASNLNIKREGSAIDMGASDFTTKQHTMTVQAGKSYQAGDKIEIAYSADEDGTYITASVASYNSSTGELKFTVEDYNDDTGTGTYNDWTVRGYNGKMENNIIRGSGALDGFVFGYEGPTIAPGSNSAGASFTISQGIADQIGGFMEKMLHVTTGSFKAEKDSLTSKNTTLTDQITRLEESVSSYVDRITAQFVNVESQMAVLNSTLDSLKAYANTSSD